MSELSRDNTHARKDHVGVSALFGTCVAGYWSRLVHERFATGPFLFVTSDVVVRMQGAGRPLLVKSVQASIVPAHPFPGINNMDEKHWDSAFMIYVVTSLDTKAALTYCAMHSDLAPERCQRMLESRFDEAPADEITCILEAQNSWSAIRRQINKWLVEYAVQVWIDDCNKNLGVAPSYEAVFQKYFRLCEEAKIKCMGYARYDSRKKLVQRWMAKWESTRTSIETHEGENVTEIVGKVPAPESPDNYNFSSFCDPHFGYQLWPRNRGQNVLVATKTGAKKRPRFRGRLGGVIFGPLWG